MKYDVLQARIDARSDENVTDFSSIINTVISRVGGDLNLDLPYFDNDNPRPSGTVKTPKELITNPGATLDRTVYQEEDYNIVSIAFIDMLFVVFATYEYRLLDSENIDYPALYREYTTNLTSVRVNLGDYLDDILIGRGNSDGVTEASFEDSPLSDRKLGW